MSETANNVYQEESESQHAIGSVLTSIDNVRKQLAANRYLIGLFGLVILFGAAVGTYFLIDIFYAQKLIPAFIIGGIIWLQRYMNPTENNHHNS